MKNIRTFSIVLWLCLFWVAPQSASAIQPQNDHSIDQWTSQCMDRDPSTYGMLQCLEQSYQKWDAALNTAYQSLRGLLQDDAKNALRDSQRAWIAYRDKEFHTIDVIYGSLQGTMWQLAIASSRAEFVKHRALELELYRESLLEGQ